MFAKIGVVAIVYDVKYICNGVAESSNPGCTVDCTPPGLAVIAAYTALSGDFLPSVTVGTTAAAKELLHKIEITLAPICLAGCAPAPAPASGKPVPQGPPASGCCRRRSRQRSAATPAPTGGGG